MLELLIGSGLVVGAAAPVVSTAEDFGSAILSFVAILVPILVILGIAALITGFAALFRQRRDAEEF